MCSLMKIETAEEYCKHWYKQLSPAQAESLDNVRKACNAIEDLNGKAINPASVGKYCFDHMNASPKEQTIRNMFVMVDGHKEKVYRTYVQKRSIEFKKKASKALAGRSASKEDLKKFTYDDILPDIENDDTRQIVRDLIQRLKLAEGAREYLAEQLEVTSKEVGGLDIVQAISQGPVDETLHLPLMAPNLQESGVISGAFLDALKAISKIPDNNELPYLDLNQQGALVYQGAGTGTVMVLTPKQWKAILAAIDEEK